MVSEKRKRQADKVWTWVWTYSGPKGAGLGPIHSNLVLKAPRPPFRNKLRCAQEIPVEPRKTTLFHDQLPQLFTISHLGHP